MAVEGIHPYVMEPDIRGGFTAGGLPIVSSPPQHPTESALPQPTGSPPASEPSTPPTQPAATISSIG